MRSVQKNTEENRNESLFPDLKCEAPFRLHGEIGRRPTPLRTNTRQFLFGSPDFNEVGSRAPLTAKPGRIVRNQPELSLEPEPLFTEADIISRYTRADAIADGGLVEVDRFEATGQHFRHPVAVLRPLWDIIEKAVTSKKHCNDHNGVLHDIFMMAKSRMALHVNRSTREFPVIITGGRRRNFWLRLQVHPGDDLEPVVTIGRPEDFD